MVLHALIRFFPILNTRSSPDLGMFNFEIVRQNHSFILPQKVVGQSRAKIGWLIQLGWRDFTGFSPRIQQFSSRFRRELLNSLRESSNSRRMFSNSRRRIRRELLILQKITTNREKRKVNLVATENWTILCCDENSYSRWDENWPILCCEENSNSRRDEICPILCCEENSNSRRDEICPVLCCEENSNSRRDEICPVLCCDENSNSRWDENCPILCCDEICPILYNLENMYQAVRGVFFLYYELAMLW